jgi:hypothetical protein
MVYSTEQNMFIVVSYFRNGGFINGKWTYSLLSDYKNKFRAKYPHNIQENVEDLREKVNET